VSGLWRTFVRRRTGVRSAPFTGGAGVVITVRVITGITGVATSHDPPATGCRRPTDRGYAEAPGTRIYILSSSPMCCFLVWCGVCLWCVGWVCREGGSDTSQGGKITRGLFATPPVALSVSRPLFCDAAHVDLLFLSPSRVRATLVFVP
jgi:hypothetical protein